MRFYSIKRSSSFVVKLGRFFVFASLFLSPLALAEEETPKDASSNFFAKPSAEVRFAARPSADLVFGYPALAMANILAGYQPLPELSVSVSAFGRVPVVAGTPHLDAFVDLYDTYIKLKQPSFTFSLGYLRTPWIVMKGAALNDRVNPIDYRRGVDFAKDGAGRIPQWGLQLTGRLNGWSLEGIYHFWHRTNPASFIAVEQDGVQIGHYQGALASTPQDFATLFPGIVQTELPWFSKPTIAIAARKTFGDVDMGLNTVWGFDEVPFIGTNPLTINAHRSLSFGADVSTTLGVVILKAEAVLTPRLDDQTGKSTLIRTGTGVQSASLTSAQAGIAVEGVYGDLLNGSIELIETAWFNVPPQACVYAIESPSPASPDYRIANRLALAFVFDGKLFDNVFMWALRGEFGLLRPDLLSTVSVRHEFGDTGFSVGAFANLFFGVDQSPGGFRNAATECGLSFGYHL